MRNRSLLATIVWVFAAFIPLAAEKVAILDEVNKPEMIVFGGGNIYILEGIHIYIYEEATFAYKNRFGKEGEGPGEIKKNPFGGPLVPFYHRGNLAVSSMGKYSVFTPEGRLVKEMKINPMDNYYPFEDIFICISTYPRDAGELYLAVYLADGGMKRAEKPLVVTDSMVGMNFKLVFPVTAFAPVPYKDKLYLAPDPMTFTIDVYSKAGQKINTISKPYKKKKISSDYRDKTIHWFKNDPTWQNLYEMFKNRITFRDHYPPIWALFVDSDKMYALTFEFDRNGDRECIVLNLKGEEIKRVFLPIRDNYGMDFVYPYNIYNDHFYIIMENLDEETWELHRIKL